MPKIIAEIGNQHFGDMVHAKELMSAAKGCGADIVKSQAFRAEDIKHGSMPPEFYKQCEFSTDEYLELISYGKRIGIEMFFSIFSNDLLELNEYQFYRKLAGAKTREGIYNHSDFDVENSFVSVPDDIIPPRFHKATILYVTPYLPAKVDLSMIDRLARFYSRPVGYSDHTIGIAKCLEALEGFNLPVIEKHFTINRDTWNGKVYRDSIHAADPKQLRELCKIAKTNTAN